ncbi:MAG: thioredoxin family protein [Muribaculaceae bacterium]|nr:thioredoxin family protein [Muribaculaceae bacterium]
MKKILFAAAVAMMALSSCGSKEAKEADAAQDAQQTEEVAPAETSAVVELADDNAYRPDTKVEGLVVLDFNATWCGPCKMLTPVFAEAAKKYTDVKFVSVDIDKLPETAKAFNVQAVPTVVFINAEGTTTFVGTDDLLPAEKFDELVKKYL